MWLSWLQDKLAWSAYAEVNLLYKTERDQLMAFCNSNDFVKFCNMVHSTVTGIKFSSGLRLDGGVHNSTVEMVVMKRNMIKAFLQYNWFTINNRIFVMNHPKVQYNCAANPFKSYKYSKESYYVLFSWLPIAKKYQKQMIMNMFSVKKKMTTMIMNTSKRRSLWMTVNAWNIFTGWCIFEEQMQTQLFQTNLVLWASDEIETVDRDSLQ